jgi:hypothetical protein
MANGYHLIPPPPGTLPYPTEGLATTVASIAEGLKAYNQAREERLEKALRRLLLRTYLTGQIGTLSPEEKEALGDIAGVKDITTLPTVRSSEGLRKLAGKYLGFTPPDTIEEQKKVLSLIESSAKNYQALTGKSDYVPPPDQIRLYESVTGTPWPKDPATGQPLPYRVGAGRSLYTPHEALRFAIDDAMKNEALPEKQRERALNRFKAFYPDAETRYPEFVSVLDRLFPSPPVPEQEPKPETRSALPDIAKSAVKTLAKSAFKTVTQPLLKLSFPYREQSTNITETPKIPSDIRSMAIQILKDNRYPVTEGNVQAVIEKLKKQGYGGT